MSDIQKVVQEMRARANKTSNLDEDIKLHGWATRIEAAQVSFPMVGDVPDGLPSEQVKALAESYIANWCPDVVKDYIANLKAAQVVDDPAKCWCVHIGPCICGAALKEQP